MSSWTDDSAAWMQEQIKADDCNLNATVAYMKAKANNEQDYDSGWWLIGKKWEAMELLLSTDWTPDRDSQFEALLKEVTVLKKAHTESNHPLQPKP